MNDNDVENEAFIDRQVDEQAVFIGKKLNNILKDISDKDNYYSEAVVSAVASTLALVVINDLREDTELGEVLDAHYGLDDINTKECRIRIDIIEKGSMENRTLN